MALFAERAPGHRRAARITAEDSFIPLGRAATADPAEPRFDRRRGAGAGRVAEKQAALVICPGRGTYGKAELGYLKRFHADKAELIAAVRPAPRRARPADHLRARRRRALQPRPAHARRHRLAADLHRLLCRFPRHRPRRASTSPRSPAIRWAGTRRSPAPARSSAEHGFGIVDAMGENSQAGEPGGQVLLTLVDEDWREVPGLREALLGLVAAIDARPGLRAPRLDRARRHARRRRQRGRPRRPARRSPADARPRAAAARQSRPVPHAR